MPNIIKYIEELMGLDASLKSVVNTVNNMVGENSNLSEPLLKIKEVLNKNTKELSAEFNNSIILNKNTLPNDLIENIKILPIDIQKELFNGVNSLKNFINEDIFTELENEFNKNYENNLKNLFEIDDKVDFNMYIKDLKEQNTIAQNNSKQASIIQIIEDNGYQIDITKEEKDNIEKLIELYDNLKTVIRKDKDGNIKFSKNWAKLFIEQIIDSEILSTLKELEENKKDDTKENDTTIKIDDKKASESKNKEEDADDEDDDIDDESKQNKTFNYSLTDIYKGTVAVYSKVLKSILEEPSLSKENKKIKIKEYFNTQSAIISAFEGHSKIIKTRTNDNGFVKEILIDKFIDTYLESNGFLNNEQLYINVDIK